MLISYFWAALRRRPFSVACGTLLAALFAALAGVSVVSALLVWWLASLLLGAVWLASEPRLFGRLGCRTPTRAERARLAVAPQQPGIVMRLVDDPAPWVGSGLRTIVLSRGTLDLLEDRPLVGLLAQAVEQQRARGVLREAMVWLGVSPLLAGWLVSRGLEWLGQLLALAIAWTLVVPVLVWPAGFVVWTGRLLGWLVVTMLGATLLSSGVAAAGLALLIAWPLVPGVRALLAWEARRAQADADAATIQAGLGWPLLEALEHLAFAEPARPRGVLGVLVRDSAPCASRIDRVWAALKTD